MKRRTSLIILASVLAVGALGVVGYFNSQKEREEKVATSAATTNAYSAQVATLVNFSSFEELEKNEKSTKGLKTAFYYVPSALTEDFELTVVRKKENPGIENSYIAIEYTVSDPSGKTVGLSGMNLYYMQTMSCFEFLYQDGSTKLQGYISLGFKAIEYDGRTMYYKTYYAQNNQNKQAVSHSVVFIEDNCLISMQIPAIDTIENVLKFTKMKKVEIE